MDDLLVSKSQKKRDAAALQKIGEQLIELSAEKLNLLPLTEDLRSAITIAKTLTSHGAQRRQSQLIGKLMRSADNQAIVAAYQQLLAEGRAQTAAFHEIELWRERLINNGKQALTEFITSFPQIDVQHLRHLVKKAVEEKTSGKPLGAGKALFRFIRSSL